MRKEYQLCRPFIMYTGGIDPRKNIDGLIRAYAELPRYLRDKHQLAIVCSIQQETKQGLFELCLQCGLNQDDVVFTDFVSEDDLVLLYNLCSLFIFPLGTKALASLL